MTSSTASIASSVKILEVYRQWTLSQQQSDLSASTWVVIDDLANRPKPKVCIPHAQDPANQLRDILASDHGLSAAEILKVENSIAYLNNESKPLSLESLHQAGFDFVDVPDQYIMDLRLRIEELREKRKSRGTSNLGERSLFEETMEILDRAFRYLQIHMPDLKAPQAIYQKAVSSAHFAAHVRTGPDGSLVCVMPDEKRGPSDFLQIMIHEVLGHVLHFTQLRDNNYLQNERPHLLALSIHTHEQFYLEAVAQIITAKLLQSDFEIPDRHGLEISLLEGRLVWTSIHKIAPMLIQNRLSLDEAADLHLGFCPGFLSHEVLKSRYSQLLASPNNVKFNCTYASSFMAVEPLLNLNDKLFYDCFHNLLNTYHTPGSLKELVKNACAL